MYVRWDVLAWLSMAIGYRRKQNLRRYTNTSARERARMQACMYARTVCMYVHTPVYASVDVHGHACLHALYVGMHVSGNLCLHIYMRHDPIHIHVPAKKHKTATSYPHFRTTAVENLKAGSF